MSSGSIDVDTISYRHAIPLTSNITAYSSLTVFATDKEGFLVPHTFYTLSKQSGFQDTSTLTTSFINQNISTTISLQSNITSNINYIGKTFVSTIPYTQWISSQTVTTYPFYYNSTFTSTFYDGTSTSFISQGVLAQASPFNFVSTYNDSSELYPGQILTSNVWLGEGMQSIINSGQYNIFVNYQYNLLLNTSDQYSWVSTVGVFNSLERFAMYGNKGTASVTRIGNNQYIQITNTHCFKAEMPGYRTQIPTNTSNFHLEIYLQSTISCKTEYAPQFDIFIPGENNFTFTCVPVLSTLVF